MQEAYVDFYNSIPTHIFTWGGWIEESLDNVKEIAICITGNPGLPGFYTEFLGALNNQLENKMPIWVIGHVGHDEPPSSSLRQVPQLHGNESCFDLDGQIKHKVEFNKKYVPEHVKIHLIGHSIGAWMILQLLQEESVRKRVKHCYMLFPTIERMIESPNGWVFTKIAMPLYSVFSFVFCILNCLPKVLRILLIQLYFWISVIPNHFIGTAMKYMQASVIQKVVFLADDEMARVRVRQNEIIRHNKDLLTLYYGTTDGWVPIKYFKQLKEDFPDIDAQLDTRKISHAFVLRHSKPMALITSDMIRTHSQLFD